MTVNNFTQKLITTILYIIFFHKGISYKRYTRYSVRTKNKMYAQDFLHTQGWLTHHVDIEHFRANLSPELPS